MVHVTVKAIGSVYTVEYCCFCDRTIWMTSSPKMEEYCPKILVKGVGPYNAHQSWTTTTLFTTEV